MEAVVWLEDYLSKWKKILLMVSHSQDFLNNVCTHIVHLTNKKLNYYTGCVTPWGFVCVMIRVVVVVKSPSSDRTHDFYLLITTKQQLRHVRADALGDGGGADEAVQLVRTRSTLLLFVRRPHPRIKSQLIDLPLISIQPTRNQHHTTGSRTRSSR